MQKESELKKTEESLNQVKGQLKAEKFKSSAAEAGSALMDGISSALGTTKVKSQQQEIESLKHENHELQQDIDGLTQTIRKERNERQQEPMQLKAEVHKIHNWLPDTSALIKWGEYCERIGFTRNQARDIIGMKPFRFTGELYSREHSQHFKTNDVEIRFERVTGIQDSFRLMIDKISLTQWLKQKYKEFLDAIGVKPKQKPEMGKSKNFRM